MNEGQQTEVKDMARRIESQAQTIIGSMQALQRNSLLDMPEDLIPINFCNAIHGSNAIQKILVEGKVIMPTERAEFLATIPAELYEDLETLLPNQLGQEGRDWNWHRRPNGEYYISTILPEVLKDLLERYEIKFSEI
jgi:hypothetical protein